MSACLPEKDFQELVKVLDNFKNSGEAAEKQAEFLKKYDNGSRNWLEKLWVEEAYLKYRGPIYHLNYGGTGDIPDGNIPLEDPKKPLTRSSCWSSRARKSWSRAPGRHTLPDETVIALPMNASSWP